MKHYIIPIIAITILTFLFLPDYLKGAIDIGGLVNGVIIYSLLVTLIMNIGILFTQKL